MVNMRALSGVFFIRTVMSFMSVLLCLHHFPKPSPPNAITLGVRVSKYEFWGTQTFGPECHLLCSLVSLTPIQPSERTASSQKPSLTTSAHCILFFLLLVNYIDSMFKIHKEPSNPSSGNGPQGKAALAITAACFPCRALCLYDDPRLVRKRRLGEMET